jgi:hypothetical protein
MSTPIPDDKLESIREDIFRGMKLQAIKTYHECTGQGLKESKEAVEALSSDLRSSSPERFIAPTPGRQIAARVVVGCFLLTVLAMGWGIAFLILHPR